MSTTNLTNLNVDMLFEQHSVAEINIVQTKIQDVVEKKREELRTMVGERYRDLLKAADTIAAMKESSNTLIAQVACINANCRSLNEQQLIGFKIDNGMQLMQQWNANKQLGNYFSTMIQIKLLTSMPELIWMHIDREHFFTATELFIFSRHISTGLQLEANNPLIQNLPVARKQWEVLKPFHKAIKQSMLAVLEREELTADVAVNCLLGLLLLEKSNLNEVFKQFLQLRCAAFCGCLSDADASKGLERRRVKDCILASLKILNSTMELIGSCFLGNGLLFQKLERHASATVPPTIARMDSNGAQFAHMLPEIISNFRPKFEQQTLDEEHVRIALDQWLTEIRRITAIQLKKLFKLVLTMSTIREIKTEGNNYRKSYNLAPIVEKFKLNHNLNFYDIKYMPLINQRVHDIIEKKWTQAVTTTFDLLQDAIENACAMREQCIWKETPNDLPLSLEAALAEDRKSKALLMNIKGYDNKIIELCTEFDRQLASIVFEVNVLLEEQTTRAEDKVALIEFLRDTAQRQVENFICQVKNLKLEHHQRCELLYVVRTFTAIIELCPHLKICFCQQSSWRQWVGNVTGSNIGCWNRICALLEEETLNFWHIILDGMILENHCEHNLARYITNDATLQDFANWDTITLDQKDEQGNTLHSTFRIPNQPRISLQLYLFNLINVLNTEMPQTLPPRILKIFNEKLHTQILVYYRQLSIDTRIQIGQNFALQLYFDLRFLQSIFGICREERTLNEEFHALQNILKDKIDPFDFELFVEHIMTNVKRSVARLQCLIGVLLPQSLLGVGIVASAVAQEMDPSVLSLSACGSTTLWFPLLPIITSDVHVSTVGERVAVGTRFEVNKLTVSPQRTTQSTTTTVTRKTDKAKSFFGAMSQEWFR